MTRILAAVALSAALIACNQKAGNNSGNGTVQNNMTATNNAAAAAPAAPAAGSFWGQAAAPAEAYRRYFDERWAQGGAAVTPAEVEAMLGNQTPQQVVNALWGSGDNSRWGTVASGIAKGDPAWLALAVRISAGTDAGTADDFGIAAGDALTTNPTGALRLLSQIEMGAGACDENGFEVPAEQARAFYQTAIASVERVTDSGLQQIKNQCLAALREGMGKYPGLNGNPPQKM
jgi:hypothetical protein